MIRAQIPRPTQILRPTKVIADAGLYRWIALRVGPGSEFIVEDDLAGSGILSYCPTGRKRVFWRNRRRVPKGSWKQYPIFTRYIFGGLLEGQYVTRDTRRKIESILSDGNGALYVPPKAIDEVNRWEREGLWDEMRDWRAHIGFSEGDAVRITSGVFSGHSATIDAIDSETRIRVLITMFGRKTTMTVEPRCLTRA